MAAEAGGCVVVEQDFVPLVADKHGDHRRDRLPVGGVRVRGVEDSTTRSFGGELDERGDVDRRRGMVGAPAAAGQQHHQASVESTLDEVPRAGGSRAAPRIFDRRSTVTGSPLSSSTCSAATLFGP